MRKLLTFAGLGAIAAYFLDPDQGTRRRNTTRDRLGGLFRRGTAKTERAVRATTAQAVGMQERAKAAARPDTAPADDNTLKAKIETEVFRPADAPKGSVNIDVVDGVVTLRGEVERPDDVNDLERKVQAIAGVRAVENLLHTPGATPEKVQEVAQEKTTKTS